MADNNHSSVPVNDAHIHICSHSVLSHYVQTGSMKLVQVDIQPFLLQSHLDGGYRTDWFTKEHLNEAVLLMRPVLESSVETKLNNEMKKSDKCKNCIFTGETVRVACSIKKSQEHNICLITHCCAPHRNIENKASSSRDQPTFQEKLLHKNKVVAFVCPRMRSSTLQLSQLVCAHMDTGRQQEDISKYFLSS